MASELIGPSLCKLASRQELGGFPPAAISISVISYMAQEASMRLLSVFFVLPSLFFVAVPAFAQDVQFGAWEAWRDPADGVCKVSIDIVDATNGGGYVFGWDDKVVVVSGVGVELTKAWADADGHLRTELKCEQNICVSDHNDIWTLILMASWADGGLFGNGKSEAPGLEIDRADGIRVGPFDVPLSGLSQQRESCGPEPDRSPQTLPPLPDSRFLNPEPEVAPLPR